MYIPIPKHSMIYGIGMTYKTNHIYIYIYHLNEHTVRDCVPPETPGPFFVLTPSLWTGIGGGSEFGCPPSCGAFGPGAWRRPAADEVCASSESKTRQRRPRRIEKWSDSPTQKNIPKKLPLLPKIVFGRLGREQRHPTVACLELIVSRRSSTVGEMH